MHAKNSELFIGFLGELCVIPLRTLSENFIPCKDRRGRCTQRPQYSLSDCFASFAKILCVLCVKIGFSQGLVLAKTAELDARKERRAFLCALCVKISFLAKTATLFIQLLGELCETSLCRRQV
jgi:hypothetical protein